MGISIEDPNTGEGAQVTDNRLRTFSVQDSLMNHLSVEVDHQTVYDVFGTISITSGTTGVSGGVVLFVQNSDPTRFLVVDRIYVQVVTLATLAQTSTYFSVGFGRIFTSGGTVLTPVNENRFTTNTANATVVNSATLLGLTGTFIEALRVYPQNGPVVEIVPQGEDGIILARGNSVEVDFASAIGSGVALVCMRFAQNLPGHMG